MDNGQARVRNMRSKCRCSYVLQFTFRRAVCCVLHRPPSQVIHCVVLSLFDSLRLPGRQSPDSLFFLRKSAPPPRRGTAASSFLHGEGEQRFARNPIRGERSFKRQVRTPGKGPPRQTREASTASVTPSRSRVTAGDRRVAKTGESPEGPIQRGKGPPNQAEAGMRTDPISDKSKERDANSLMILLQVHLQ